MRYAVIGDVHGNLPALRGVLDALAEEQVDGYICPGDLVGYGPRPDEVVAAVAELEPVAVAGNHDLIALDKLSIDRCGALARTTLAWTKTAIAPGTRTTLDALPTRAAAGSILVAHGSLDDPERYIGDADSAVRELERMRELDPGARILVLGHTHLPLAVGERRGLLDLDRGRVELDGDERILLNAGSVGQSRESRPRARFMIVDLARGEAVFHAIRYDTNAVRRQLRAAGLPEDAYHARPSASSPLAVAIMKATPGPVRKVYRRVRRFVLG